MTGAKTGRTNKPGAGRPTPKTGKRVNVYLPGDLLDWWKTTTNRSEYIAAAIRNQRALDATTTDTMIVEGKMDEKKLLAIAEAIYSEVSGADNKQEHAQLVNEIYDWLYNGDNPDSYTMADVPAFVKEWKQYSGA